MKACQRVIATLIYNAECSAESTSVDQILTRMCTQPSTELSTLVKVVYGVALIYITMLTLVCGSVVWIFYKIATNLSAAIYVASNCAVTSCDSYQEFCEGGDRTGQQAAGRVSRCTNTVVAARCTRNDTSRQLQQLHRTNCTLSQQY